MHYINKTRFFALFLSLILLFTLALSYVKTTGNHISNAVLRLHIIPNSSSLSDQYLKFQVRDRVLGDTSALFENATSPENARLVAIKNRETIKNSAEAELRRLGCDYPVSVTVTRADFPTKKYGSVTLPAGTYDAVQIKIGSAEGKNWWCVMYPPLCFTDGVVSDKSLKKLKTSLSPEEYQLITKNTQSKPSVQVRFKIVEILQGLF